MRASAAARAAFEARRRGSSADEAADLAAAVYAQPAQPNAVAASRSVQALTVVRPTGWAGLLTSLVIVVAVGYWRSSGDVFDPVWLGVLCATALLGLAVVIRSRIIVDTDEVRVIGLRSRRFRRLDIREISVSGAGPLRTGVGLWFGWLGLPLTVQFIGEDVATLARLRLGGWRRSDIDRAASVMGVPVRDAVLDN